MLKLYSLITFLIGIAGAAATVYGAWQIHPPAAWILGGVFAISMSFIYARGLAARQFQQQYRPQPPKDQERD